MGLPRTDKDTITIHGEQLPRRTYQNRSAITIPNTLSWVLTIGETATTLSLLEPSDLERRVRTHNAYKDANSKALSADYQHMARLQDAARLADDQPYESTKAQAFLARALTTPNLWKHNLRSYQQLCDEYSASLADKQQFHEHLHDILDNHTQSIKAWNDTRYDELQDLNTHIAFQHKQFARTAKRSKNAMQRVTDSLYARQTKP